MTVYDSSSLTSKTSEANVKDFVYPKKYITFYKCLQVLSSSYLSSSCERTPPKDWRLNSKQLYKNVQGGKEMFLERIQEGPL